MKLWLIAVPTALGCLALTFSLMVMASVLLVGETDPKKTTTGPKFLVPLTTVGWFGASLIADVIAFCTLTTAAFLAHTEKSWAIFLFMATYLLAKGYWIYSEMKPRIK